MSGTRSVRFAAVALAVALATTACGSSKDKVSSAAASVASAASRLQSAQSAAASQLQSAGSQLQSEQSQAASELSSMAAAAHSEAASRGSDCDAAQMEIKAGLSVSGFVKDVKILGGCTTASVSTSLTKDADGIQSAIGICEIAATQGYSHGVGAISVESADGKELATGIKGASCIGEP
ncbi:MAG: hypothetical protein ABI912_04085 [Actinomycetota bacterium]